METRKYRKKPVVIEAFKYDGDLTDENGSFYIPEWAINAYSKGVLFYSSLDSNNPPCELFIKTLEGNMLVNVGDFIIKGINSELYPCKPDIFEKTYEPIKEE